jgi:hypothetical protein
VDRDFQPFAHLTAPRAELYRQVMGVFAQAKRRFAVHLRPEDVREALAAAGLPLDLAVVSDALASLED